MNKIVATALLSAFVESFEPPWTGSVHQWANQYVELPQNYAVTGKFDVSISKYLIQPFEDLKDRNVQQVNLIAATQTGKTLVSEVFLPFLIINDPGPVLKLSQSDEMSQLFTETRVLPLLQKCKPVRSLLDHDRFSAKKSGINLPHISVKMAGAKENVLHGQSIRYLLGDEVWLWATDTVTKAKARTTAFGNNKKILLTSQPGVEGDQLEQENVGLEYTWGWRCPHCEKYQTFEWSKEKEDGSWSGIVWERHFTDLSSGSYDYEKTGGSAKLQCYYCTGSLEDTEANRRYLNDTGQYLLTSDKGNHRVKTYRWNCFVNQKISFKEKTIQFLQAKAQHSKYGTTDALKVFTQQVLGRPWKQSAPMDQSKILVATFDKDAAWPDQVFRCLSVDYQKKHEMKFWCAVAFSPKEIRVLDHGYCKRWDELDLISKKYNIPAPAVCVDSGYNAQEVYAESYARAKVMRLGNKIELIGWCCLKGDDQDEGYKHNGPNGEKYIKYYSTLTRPVLSNNKYARLYHWANLPIKTILYNIREGKSDMKLVLPVPDPDFDAQMHSETLQDVIDAKTGLMKKRWVKHNDNNHYWDCLCQSIVMCMMAGQFASEPIAIIPAQSANAQ